MPDSTLYHSFLGTRPDTIPRQLRRQMVAASSKLARAREEESDVHSDFSSALHFLLDQHNKVQAAFQALLQADDTATKEDSVPVVSGDLGMCSFLFHKMWSLEREVTNLCSALHAASPQSSAFATTFVQTALQGGSEECVEEVTNLELIEELSNEVDVVEFLDCIDQSVVEADD